MNERDKELTNQAWQQRPEWQAGYVNIPMLIALIRADEREACAKLCEKQIEKENLLKTGDNQTLSNLLIGHRVTAHMTDARLIRARRNK